MADADHIIEAAFTNAFSPPSQRRQSVQPAPKVSPEALDSIPGPQDTLPPPPSSTESSSSPQDSWKLEYEEQVQTWRAQSAEAREKAESVRGQWEARRATEREALADTSPESQDIPGPGYTQPSQLEAQNEGGKQEIKAELRETAVTDLVSGRPTKRAGGSMTSTLARVGSQLDTHDGSQRWEEVISPASSYPSMSFPEQSTTPPLHPHPTPQTPPQSATLSVFDPSLSTRTRLKAFVSSLAINLFLPFVNGVMLGFGEIFAKNFILGWLGWGSTATTVGVYQRQRFGQPGLR